MQCPLCGHDKADKHGRTPKGVQRFKCPQCNQTFTETLDTLYYRRQVSEAEVHTMLQSHSEGASLRGVSRITRRAYNTVVSVVRQASHKAQQVHNGEVQQVEADELISDEMWSFAQKNRSSALVENQSKGTAGLL
jgi:transposase-like protein